MKQLTENEIKFIKETKWTPTLYQYNYADFELKRTPYAGMSAEEAGKKYEIELAEKYNINVHELYDKTCNLDNSDGISLEYEATYLFYTFFTKEELEKMTDKEATEWLKNFKYNFGYRKWDDGNIQYVMEALDIYNGNRVLVMQDDGDIWSISKDEEPNSWVWDHPEVILH